MAIDPDAVHLEVESWILFGVATSIFMARMLSRRLLLGAWSKLKIDDYLMVLAVATYTGVIVFVNQTAQNLDNYLPPGAFETFTPKDIKNAIYGSKCVFITEEMMLATLWLCKACLLIMYSSLTAGLPKQHRLVKYVGGYCVFGYILTQILFLGVWCRPIQQYWWVPVVDSQCASYYHHLITASVFNISSDLMMLLIPLPLLLKARLPPKRKAILVGVFSLGIFVILAAILNRYYNFTAGYGSLIYLNWYAGEASTAVIVANTPHCWPLLARTFSLGSFKTTGPSGLSSGSTPHRRSKFSSFTGPRSALRSTKGHERMDNDTDRDSIERIITRGTGPGKRDEHITQDIADVELGEMGAAPKYEAHASATKRISGGHWVPGHEAHEVGEGMDGGIVKTVVMDQRYENE